MRILLAFFAFFFISWAPNCNCAHASPDAEIETPAADAGLPSAPAPPSAADPNKQLAKIKYDHGTVAFRAKRFAEAERLFEEANSLDPNPILLYNLARTREELGKYAEAMRLFEAYIARPEPTREERGEASERVTHLRVKIAEQEQKKPPAPEKSSPPVVAKQAAPPPKPPAPPSAVTGKVRPTQRPFYQRLPPWYSWAAFGTGLAATGGAIWLGVEANDRADTAEDPRTTQIDAQRARDESDQFATGSYALWGTAGVALATGVVLWVLDVEDPPTIAPSKNGAALGFSF